MPRYHFESVDGHREADPEGVELADDDAACAMAVEFAGEVLKGNPALLCRGSAWRVEVRDDGGRLQFTVLTSIVVATD